jgi:hypothetical protein
MDKSSRATVFVFVTLLVVATIGLTMYFVYSRDAVTAVPLLIACVLLTVGLVVGTVRLVAGYHRNERLAAQDQVPNPVLRELSLPQWVTLLLGVTVVAVGTGALTGVRLLAGETIDPPAALPALPAAPATTTSAPVVIVSDLPSPTPSPTPTLSVSADPSVEPTSSLSTTLRSGTTKYLDSEPELAGRSDARAINFSAQRYQRGISFYCATATSTYLQWNVAGFNRFEAVGGIDDNTENAYGAVVEFLFYDQDGRQLLPKAVEASVGRAQVIKIDLAGVVSLRMTCSGRDAKTSKQRSTYAAFGDPIVVKS